LENKRVEQVLLRGRGREEVTQIILKVNAKMMK
jgi:hypothetical protein